MADRCTIHLVQQRIRVCNSGHGGIDLDTDVRIGWCAIPILVGCNEETGRAASRVDDDFAMARSNGLDNELDYMPRGPERTLTPDLGHVESSSCWRKRDDQDHGQEELLR